MECDCLHYHEDKLRRAQDSLAPNEDIISLAEFFKVFGDPTRVKILMSLINEELCVCDIAELLNMEQSAISHQLSILKRTKLVNARREGKAIYYSTADDHINTIINMGYEHIKEV